MKQLKDIIYNYFDKKYNTGKVEKGYYDLIYTPNDSIIELFNNVLTRYILNKCRNIDICESDENIYTEDHWNILKEYSDDPQTANYDEAYNEYYDDLCNIAEIVKNHHEKGELIYDK